MRREHPVHRALGRSFGALTAAMLFLLWSAVPAAAQTDTTIALGGGIAFYEPIDDMAHDSVGFAFTYRIGRPQGFRPTFGFNWYATDFDTIVAGDRVPLGRLSVRPVMAGYGYWSSHGRVTLGATAIAGIAFNSFDTADAARLAYDRRLDELLLRIDASHGLAARAEFGVSYDLTSRIGLLGSIGYVAARPTITIATDVGRTSQRLRADAIKFQIGVVYGVF